jgi:hypothetical protein
MPTRRPGPPYTAPLGDQRLQAYARELNCAFPTALPPIAYYATVRRPREDSILGVFIKDGLTVPHDTRLALYWGHITTSPPAASDYVVQLPPPVRAGPMTGVCIDARLHCLSGDPPPTGPLVLCCLPPPS